MSDLFLSDALVLVQGLLALVLGGVVGWERERKGKGAGFRTMMLVSFGSFLFVKVSLAAGSLTPGGLEGVVQTDPVRSIQSIATALGFVGAGIVFRDRETNQTRGVTTAAALLTIAPVGIAVAIGHYVLAVGATLLMVAVLSVGDRIEDRYIHMRQS